MAVTEVIKLEGIADLEPFRAKALFAKAWLLEHNAGHTTPEAEAKLAEAVKAEEG